MHCLRGRNTQKSYINDPNSFCFAYQNGFLKFMKEMMILRNLPKISMKIFIYLAMLRIVYSKHLHTLLLDFTTTISLSQLYHKSIHFYATLFIVFLDAFLSNLQTSTYFILNTSTYVSLKGSFQVQGLNCGRCRPWQAVGKRTVGRLQYFTRYDYINVT